MSDICRCGVPWAVEVLTVLWCGVQSKLQQTFVTNHLQVVIGQAVPAGTEVRQPYNSTHTAPLIPEPDAQSMAKPCMTTQ